MIDKEFQSHVIDLLVTVNSAIRNLQLYPPTSTMIINSFDRVISSFDPIFETKNNLILSESERELLIYGVPFEEEFRKRPQVHGFCDLLLRYRLKSITFEKGLSREEFLSFISIMTRKREDIEAAGGFARLFSENEIVHIKADQKVFVAVDKIPRVGSGGTGSMDGSATQSLESFGFGGTAGEMAISGASLKTTLELILKGNLSQALNPQTAKALPQKLGEMYGKGQGKIAHGVVGKLKEHLKKSDSAMQSAILKMIAELSRILIQDDKFEEQKELTDMIVQWLKTDISQTPDYENIFALVMEFEYELICKFKLDESLRILEVLADIKKGKFNRSDEVVDLVKNGLFALARDDVLEKLSDEFQTNEHLQMGPAMNVMVIMGEKTLTMLLDLLYESEDRYERELILNALPKMSFAISHEIVDRLKKGGPWYYMRNMIHLLGKIGDAAVPRLLKPYLMHEDFRIHREALNTIYIIGGKECEQVLIESLPQINHRLQLRVISILNSIKSMDATKTLIKLLLQKTGDNSLDAIQIKEQLCVALGNIAPKEAFPVLKDIVVANQEPEKIIKIAKNALLLIKKKYTKTDQTAQQTPEPETRPEVKAKVKAPPVKKDRNAVPVVPTKVFEAISQEPSPQSRNDSNLPEADTLQKMIDQGDKEKAITACMDLVIKYAAEKEFGLAEKYAEKIMEIDELALSEIVRANEIIEQEKSQAAHLENIELWNSLLNDLTTQEANAFYYSLKEMTFDSGKTIIEQGVFYPYLYFINQGEVQAVYTKDNRQNLIATFKAGDIIGEESFFSNSVCTVSFLCASQTTGYALHSDNLAKWEKDVPALKGKIFNFCFKREKLSALIKSKGYDRRDSARFEISGEVLLQAVKENGEPLGKAFKGELLDISAGGVCLNIKASQEERARMLLGRYLKMGIRPFLRNFTEPIKIMGQVLGVRHLMFNDFSLHIKFGKNLSENIIARIADRKDDPLDDTDILLTP